MNFTERSPIEVGFAKVFDEDVRPKLQDLETGRKSGLKRAFRNIALVFAIGVFLAAGILMVIDMQEPTGLLLVVTMFTGVGMWVTWGMAADKWTSAVAQAVMPSICAHVGDLTHSTDGKAFEIETMRHMKLLPSYDKAIRTNLLRGTYQTTSYEMVHATLTQDTNDSKGNRRTTTMFSGLLFHIDVPIVAPGRIVLMRDHGGLGNKLAETFAFGGTRSLPKVNFDHAAFEAKFEVYAEKPDAAKDFLPDPFLDALLKIGIEHGGRKGAKAFVAGFEGQSFYMALKRSGGFMQMGSLTKSVMDMESELHGVFDDISLSHRIIDRLHEA